VFQFFNIYQTNTSPFNLFGLFRSIYLNHFKAKSQGLLFITDIFYMKQLTAIVFQCSLWLDASLAPAVPVIGNSPPGLPPQRATARDRPYTGLCLFIEFHPLLCLPGHVVFINLFFSRKIKNSVPGTAMGQQLLEAAVF
jgi:hypothetical protein